MPSPIPGTEMPDIGRWPLVRLLNGLLNPVADESATGRTLRE